MGINIPPIKITDSLDKPNPGSIEAVDTSYKWKVPAMIIGLIIYLLAWGILQYQISVEVQSTLDTRLLTVLKWIINLVFAAAPFILLFSVTSIINAAKERLGLVNVNDAQMTITQLKEKTNLEIARLKMEVELMRAQTQKYPASAVSVQEQISNSSNSTTKVEEKQSPQDNSLNIPMIALDEI